MTTIILNPEAVNALFPEGTEARVELQRSVLAQLVKQFVKHPDISTEIHKLLTEARKSVVDDVMRQMGAKRIGVWGQSYSFDTAFMDKLRAEVHGAISEELRIHVARATEVASLYQRVEEQIDSFTIAKVRPAVNKAIADSLAGLGTLATAFKGS